MLRMLVTQSALGRSEGKLGLRAELLQGSGSEGTGNAKYRRLVESVLRSN